MPSDVLSQGQIEGQIVALVDELADETYRYAAVEEMAATFEADYKYRFARSLLDVAANTSDRRVTAGEREATADVASASEFKVWKIHDARRRASKEALLSIRARLDALRTLSANIRQQT